RPVGLVAAKGSGVDRVLEVPRERWVLLPDPLDALADAAGDSLARPIRDVAALAGPPAEPEGGRQLRTQELDLGTERLRAARVGPLGRLSELRFEVVEPLAVGGPRGRVEPLARVAESCGDLTRLGTASCRLERRHCLGAGGQLRGVDLLTLMAQE